MLWQLICSGFNVSEFIFPSPRAIGEKLVEFRGVIAGHAWRTYWVEHDFIELHTPKLMASASESKAELFEVEYFETKAYLSQSPQFFKQMAQPAGFGKIFEVGPAFRADPFAGPAEEALAFDSGVAGVIADGLIAATGPAHARPSSTAPLPRVSSSSPQSAC